ncbi:hypothetical protein HOP60_01270 [Halomonas daqingensis]|uniref:Uncharacterized protein n=1 Tax=Billgrantia desiderata TaxID=52021 RepID=A0ABS9B088_9GAMM|nr:hypothetical protein [Halomonas desiderata]MCE8040782.1 hypothetical protein [Halomonas desiderata]MCE8045357.1 hypothetical protein [Halomonas desiderata]
MDDELKAIQADLDSVLDRLAAYVSSEEVDGAGKDREAAARVVLHYARGRGSLGQSVRIAGEVVEGCRQGPKIRPDSRLGELADVEQNDGLADLVGAMHALWEWQWHRLPLEEKHTAVLARAVDAWAHKRCQFIGENFGLELTPKRRVDPRASARERAAHEVFALHQWHPETFPLTEALFEKIGEQYGMSTSTVARAYYGCASAQEAREWIKENPPRRLSENGET